MTKVGRLFVGAAFPVGVVLAYALWTSSSPNPFYPTPAKIVERFKDLWLFDRAESDVLPSLLNLLTGWSIAVVVGVVGGVLLGRVKILGLLFGPLLDFGRSVSPIMLIPPLILILGIGDSSKIAIIAFGAFFPILLSTMDGLRQTDAAIIDVTRSLRLSRTREIRVAWLPSAAPSISGGMQTGLQFATTLMVASEMLAAVRGIGYVTRQAQVTFDSTSVWAGILLLAVLGFALNAGFMFVRSRALAWYDGMRAVSRSR